MRNVTADHLAGVAQDEVDDPRPYCEIIRQWATLHPEFTYLPRKFKIAVTGSPEDRAASEVHDIGLHMKRDADGQPRLRGAGRRRPRPHADHRPGDPRVPAAAGPALVSRGHPARLQPLRPARQHPQGAHQDPGEIARHRGIPRGGRSRVARRAGLRARRSSMAEVERVRSFFTPPRVRDAGRRRRRARSRARIPGLVSLQHAPAQGAAAIAPRSFR